MEEANTEYVFLIYRIQFWKEKEVIFTCLKVYCNYWYLFFQFV